MIGEIKKGDIVKQTIVGFEETNVFIVDSIKGGKAYSKGNSDISKLSELQIIKT